MRNIGILAIVGVLTLSLAGCGGGYNAPPPPPPPIVTVQILSDLASDGDIAFDPVQSSFSVITGSSSVQFGIDSFNIHLPEFRAFLTFPLDGSTGQPIVPGDALIVSATVEVFVTLLDFASTVPTFLDLVQYPFRGLAAVDFDAFPLATRQFDFFASDLGFLVPIDVTSLMQAAQVPPALLDFQLRFSSDITRSGLVVLDDTLPATAPLLTVTYTMPSTSVPPLAPSSPSAEVGRSVANRPRPMEGIAPRQPATAMPLSPAEMAARRR